MNRTLLTATALAALLAGAPVAAFAWSNSQGASITNPSTTSQGNNGTAAGAR